MIEIKITRPQIKTWGDPVVLEGPLGQKARSVFEKKVIPSWPSVCRGENPDPFAGAMSTIASLADRAEPAAGWRILLPAGPGITSRRGTTISYTEEDLAEGRRIKAALWMPLGKKGALEG